MFRIRSCMSFVVVLILSSTASFGASENSVQNITGLWDTALSKYVDKDGFVYYKGWVKDRGNLEQYLKALATISAEQYNKMNRQEKLALWINAYNAFTIKQILEHYPIRRSGINFYPDNSIRQIDGVWDKYTVTVGGRTVSLSQIENDILRREIQEPLIHFAINCASKSCPKLQNYAYRPETLSEELDKSAREFLADASRNRIDPSNRKVELSKIFDWFGDDFKQHVSARPIPNRSAKEQAIINFMLKYANGQTKEFIASNKFNITYLPYDWTLNEKDLNK